MTANFLPLLAPANEMSYDTLQFYNQASAIIAGVAIAALSFRLLPPLSPAFRTRRLLMLTLRDLRRLAAGRKGEWEGRVQGRLEAMPDEATPVQRSQLVAAMSVGSEILRLRRVAARLGLLPKLAPALAAVAQGNSGLAIASLAGLDAALATPPPSEAHAALRARSDILAISEALARHHGFFDAGARR